ncbi:MAG: hypothetical protein NTZ51_07635 [Proteobacteria bacterium]|nr:hypothetical protein [Pseudomonadota bacterium]
MNQGIGKKNNSRIKFLLVFLSAALCFVTASCIKTEKVGVLFVIHGGFPTMEAQYVWDSSVQQFSYDPNHPASTVMHNASLWGIMFQQETAIKYLLKYAFEYERLGGTDPFQSITDRQMQDMKDSLDTSGKWYGKAFEFDWAGWMSGDDVSHYPYPRYIYNPPASGGDKCTYCGEQEAGGPWQGCNPDRYDVDGPVERLLKKGASRIIMIDLTVGGVRFSKTYNVYTMSKLVLDNWNSEHGTAIPLIWINDYTNLMERSYPTEPAGWTATLGLPTKDSVVPLSGSPNPVAEDPELAALHVEGIEATMSDKVSDADTGVILLNHAINDNNEVFDPKIDDTLILNKNIKTQLLQKHSDMSPNNIIGAYMGIKELNPENGLVERTREMRGEDLGYAWLYESAKQLPGDEWGYRYWGALEYLKNRGVKHIVIAFPQIITNSVLDLVEIPNQIAKEIGFKTWIKDKTGDTATYPTIGNPFTDYWGNWVDTQCGEQPCCFEMGGCSDGRPYPPPRQTALDKKRGDMDPSLAYDVSEYGDLGYDPAIGPPDPDNPVQDQYTGTWAMWTPPNDNPRVGKLLAKYVLGAALNKIK